jgi:hypothetical protein
MTNDQYKNNDRENLAVVVHFLPHPLNRYSESLLSEQPIVQQRLGADEQRDETKDLHEHGGGGKNGERIVLRLHNNRIAG